MKKLKKLLAVALALAMTASLCLTALATEDDPTPVTTISGGNTQQTIDAQSITQGAIPDKPISIILPTVTARANLEEGQAQVFDFYLDPHQLITKTEAARYEGFTFAPDTRLYFAADEEKSEYTYDSASQSLTVTNTGFVDLDVDLDLEFDNGGAKFDLVSSPSAFSANAAEEVPAEMYLAVVGGGQTKPVLKPTTDPETVDVTEDDEYEINFLNASGAKFNYTPFSNSLYGLTNSSAADVVAAAKESYDAQKDALNALLKDAILTFSYEEDSDNTTAGNQPAITVALTNVEGGSSPFTVTIKKSDNSVATGGKFTGAGSGTVVITVDDGRGTTESGDDVSYDLAKISFTLVFPGASSSIADTDEQSFKFNVPHTGAKIETALGVLENSYKLNYTEDAEEKAALAASNVEVTDNGYYWEQIIDDPTLYPAFSFHLVGDINEALNTDDDTSPWDLVENNSTTGITAISFEMIWDVTLYDKTQGRTKLTTPAGAEEENNDVAPTVVVTTPATGTGSTTKTATLTWTAGSGIYEACVPTAVKSGNASGTSITFSNTGNTLKLTASTTNKNSKCTITFSDGTNSVDVEVNGWYTGT